MDTILVLLHTDADGRLPKAALESIRTARDLSTGLAGAFVVGLVGDKPEAALEAIGACGASRFVAIEGQAFSQPRYGTDAAAAEAIVRATGATVVLAPMTSRWARVVPGVAFRIGGRIDTHVTGIEVSGGRISAKRWYYRQRMEASLSRAARPWFVLLDPGSQPAWMGESAPVTVERLASPATDEPRTVVEGIDAPPADAQTIRPDAALLFVAGAGWTKKQADGQTHAAEAEQLILQFLQHTKASLGGSKSLVDLSGEGQTVLRFMTHMNQIGQTGATPRHPKGLSTCCHGEEPHVVGWRFVNERRAINLDPNCGWARGKADVVYVADAFEVMRQLHTILSSHS